MQNLNSAFTIVTLQKKAIRIINNQPRNRYSSLLYKKISILKFEDEILINKIIFISKSINDLLPQIFKNMSLRPAWSCSCRQACRQISLPALLIVQAFYRKSHRQKFIFLSRLKETCSLIFVSKEKYIRKTSHLWKQFISIKIYKSILS